MFNLMMGDLEFTYNPLAWSFTFSNVDEQTCIHISPLSENNGIQHSIGDS